MDSSSGWRLNVWAVTAYALVAIVFTWPLAAHLGTHLTGSPAGDTGVYIWNQWVFQDALRHHGSPYFTDKIFSLSGRANLSLHNYTAFQDLVAFPAIPLAGVVATFNLVYLLMTVLTGYATFLLARHVGGGTLEPWLAGLLFAWSPNLTTRGGAHFSLVAAAPLAVFLLLLLRAAERQRMRDALALGATCWWAASSDAYYAVYCILLAALFMIGRVLTIERRPAGQRMRGLRWTLDVMLFCVGALVVSMMISGGWQFAILAHVVSVRTLYTPVLVLTLLACARIVLIHRSSLLQLHWGEARRMLRLGAAAGVTAAILLSPVLFAVWQRVAEGRWDRERVFWRNSPPGVDVASFFLPNPNHPLSPAAIREWLTPRPDAFFENVASLTFIALAVMLVAWRGGWRIPRLWAAIAVVFGALALGPFVHVLNVNTHIPGPWAFLRYAPIIGLARTPARFSIVVMLAVAILFASSLRWLTERWHQRRRIVLSVVCALMLFELLPAPRTLYSAEVPQMYQRVAEAPESMRILELPIGVRDGTSSVGNFSARYQFFQTMHHKRLIGGYLSRVSRRRVTDVRRNPMVDALIWLSENRPLDDSRRSLLVEAGPSFVREANLAFVIIDRDRTPYALRAFAIDAFDLELIEADGSLELYRCPAPEITH